VPSFSFDEPVDTDQFYLRRQRIALRKLMPQEPDLFDSLELRTRIKDDLIRSMVIELRGHVYTEDLPPEKITCSKTIQFHESVESFAEVIDGPWQRFKYHHRVGGRGPILRWLVRTLMWCHLMRPVRYRRTRATFPLDHEDKITLTVDLRRFRIYPGSNLGPPTPGQLGKTVMRGHTLSLDWSHD